MSSWACPPRDRDEVAEHALTCELRAGTGTRHHHLSDGFSSADDRVYDPRDAGERILFGEESGLDSRREARRGDPRLSRFVPPRAPSAWLHENGEWWPKPDEN